MTRVGTLAARIRRPPDPRTTREHLPSGSGASALEHHPGERTFGLPRVRRFEVASPRVAPEHDGLTIAHLTDLHVHRERSARPTRRAIAVLNELAPDLVVLTGDYVRYSKDGLPHLRDALAELEAPKVATLGNHDHWLDAKDVSAALEDGGCRVLTNAHETVAVRGAPLHVVGIDDRLTRHDDAERAFQGVPEEGTRLVLSHIAEVADEIAGHESALVLSGHTHGGQVRIPFFTRRFFQRMGRHYFSGFYPVDGQILYVSHGIGASVPIRFRAPAECAVFTLKPVGAANDRETGRGERQQGRSTGNNNDNDEST